MCIRDSLTGIVGPDGAGKTTLMRILATLLKPDSGNVSVANFDPVKQFRDVKDNIGYMPPVSYTHLDVYKRQD